MCLLYLAINQRPDYPLIIAANRDEFYPRPTRPLQAWPEDESLIAGKDLEAGGTWLGIHRHGRFAAITNIRNPQAPKGRISRGQLPLDFLTSSLTLEQFQRVLENSRQDYSGYNLLYGYLNTEQVTIWHYNNQLNAHHLLNDGIHGLSNASLDTAWPKVVEGKQALARILDKGMSQAALFELLADQTQADDDRLPRTGIPIASEKALSSRFIHLDGYGTRASTLLLLDHRRQCTLVERSFDEAGLATHTATITVVTG